MKKFSLLLFVSILLAFTNFCYKGSSTRWIRVEYMGDVSKPFPILILYTENSVDTTISTDTTYEDFFSRKIQVSEIEFFSIIESIKKINFTPQFPQLRDSLAVIIRQNDQVEVLKSSSVAQIKQVFGSVMANLKDHENNIIIERYINQFKRRLGVANAFLWYKLPGYNIAFKSPLMIRKDNIF
jgi:hypothetical protein